MNRSQVNLRSRLSEGLKEIHGCRIFHSSADRLYASISIVYIQKKKKWNERAKRNTRNYGIRLGRQVAVIGLADLERRALKGRSKGRSSVLEWDVRLRNRRGKRKLGKAGAVLVEDPGELEGVFGPQRETSEDRDGERGDGMCVVTRLTWSLARAGG